MPRRKVGKKTRRPKRRTRRVVKRRGNKKASTAIMRGPTGFPDRVFVKLKFTDVLSISIASGIWTYYTWRGNSVYDPNYTGTGAQPLGFDQWAAFYTRYRVHGSKIRVRTSPTTTSTATAQTHAIVVAPATSAITLPTAPLDMLAQPYATTKVTVLQNALMKENWITKYMSSAKILGVRKTAIKDEIDFSSLTNNNPSQQWYWNMFIGPLDNSSTTTALQLIELTYYVEFFDRQTLDQS